MTAAAVAGVVQQVLWRPPVRAVLVVLALVAVCYGGAIHGSTVSFDTPWLVVDNPVLGTGSLDALPAIWFDMSPGMRRTLGAEYLPVRDMTVLLDFALFGRSWAAHHAVNVLWYGASVALFLGVAATLLGRGVAALLAAALFAVHPVHVESVAWLASRKDVVSLALFMAALWLYLLRDRWRGAVPLSVALALLAYWAKNTAIVLGPVLVLASLLHHRDDPRTRRFWIQWLPYVAVLGFGLSLTLDFGQEMGMYWYDRHPSALGRLNIQAQVWSRYFGLLTWPTGLAVLHAEPGVVAWSDPRALGGLVGVVAMGGLVPLCWRRAPVVALGSGWFLLALAPTSQLVSLQNLMADRYLLLPSAGLALALAGVPWGRLASAAAAAGTVATLGLAWVTVSYVPTFHDAAALWARVVEVEPDVPRGYTGLAGVLTEAGDHEGADAVLQQGLAHLPGDISLTQGLGQLRLAQGRLDQAIALFEEVLAAQPDRRRAANNLAILYLRKGRADDAVAVARRLTGYRPLYEEGWNTLSAACIETRDLDCAQAAAEQALALAPLDAAPLVNLGNVAYLRDDHAEARRLWTAALALDAGSLRAQAGLEWLDRQGL